MYSFCILFASFVELISEDWILFVDSDKRCKILLNLARLAASVFYFWPLEWVWAADGAGILKISLWGLRMKLLERMRLKRALKWLI